VVAAAFRFGFRLVFMFMMAKTFPRKEKYKKYSWIGQKVYVKEGHTKSISLRPLCYVPCNPVLTLIFLYVSRTVDLHDVHRTSENVIYCATARSTFVNVPYQAGMTSPQGNWGLSGGRRSHTLIRWWWCSQRTQAPR